MITFIVFPHVKKETQQQKQLEHNTKWLLFLLLALE